MFIFSVTDNCKMCQEEIDRLQTEYDVRFKDVGGAIILPKGVTFVANVNPNQTTYDYDDNDFFDDEDDGFDSDNDNDTQTN